MDCSFKFIKKKPKQRIIEINWSELHLPIVRDYFLNLSMTCNLRDLREQPCDVFSNDKYWFSLRGSLKISAEEAASFEEELQKLFMVPRLKKSHESENCIKISQLLEAFTSFLLQLLYHRTDSIDDSCKDRIDNLEKELRFLLTILGDKSLILCDEAEEFQKLLTEFEAVANEAGSLVHSLLFSFDRDFGEVINGLDVVLEHIGLLKANMMKFLNLLSYVGRSAHMTPKTSVVDSLLFVDSLIHDLEDLMKQEDNRIVDVKDQIEILHKGLILFQSSVKDIGSPTPSEIGEFKEPLMQIGDMAHEAEYLIISFLVGDAPMWYLLNRLTHVNYKIELINFRLQEITKTYKFRGLKVAKYSSAQVSSQDKRNPDANDVTTGFEDKTTYILHHLVGETKHRQVILIFGMPGLGKTTLAKELYNHPSVKYRFDKISWCVVTQTYQRQSMLADILIQLSEFHKASTSKMDEKMLVEQIHKTLKGRRYLIVMDDIWDSNAWDDFKECFPDDGNESRILLTSRNKDVAPPDSIFYELPSLSCDQCWELLEKKVFANKSCPPELLRIGKKIAANCYGLPLAVVVVAGILSSMDNEESKWNEVAKNLASHISRDNSVMQILELSYKHLSEHLRPCFLYFASFREDEEIPIRNLMRLWIAEGFIHKQEAKNAENAVEEYLMELIEKSLVMVAKRRADGGVKACVMHDLLRDLCFKKSKEENFLKVVKNDFYSVHREIHRVRNVKEHRATSIYCQHIRSFYGHRLENAPLYVRDIRLLRVLHFECIRSHYIGIEFLISLRYLVISDLPPSIGTLVNLEYLRVQTTKLVRLSSAILTMKKLRYIHVGSKTMYGKDCNSSQTNNLDYLSRVLIWRVEDEEMLTCSPNLRKLKCKFPELLSEREAYRNLDLSSLTQLETLNMEYSSVSIRKGIVFPSNIKKLTLADAVLTRTKMSIIGRLENLEILKLRYCAFEGYRWDTRNGEFQKLKFLKLCANRLTQWNVNSSEHFSRLQRLVLSNLPSLKEISSEIGEITTLEMIEVLGPCTKSLTESAEIIQQQQREMGNEEFRVIIAPHYSE